MGRRVVLLAFAVTACARAEIAGPALPSLRAGPEIARLEVAWAHPPDAACPEGALIITLTASSAHGFYVGAMPSGVTIGGREALFLSGADARVERWVYFGTPPDGALVVRGLGSGTPLVWRAGCGAAPLTSPRGT